MILNIGKENVSTNNSRVLKAVGSNVNTKNSTILTEDTLPSWCFNTSQPRSLM